MTEQFRDLMKQRAEQVRFSSLTESAIRSGRRLRHVRYGLAGIAVITLTAGMTGGYLALQPGPGDAPPAYTPILTELPAWTELPETLTYQWYESYTAVRLSDGGETLMQLPYSEDDTTDTGPVEWNVSPDGERLSSVDAAGLHIGPIDGSEPPLVLADDRLCETQAWAPDSSAVMVAGCGEDTNSLIVVSAETGGAFTIEDVGPIRSALWTSDGSRMVWGHPDHGYTIADYDGANRQPFNVGTISTASLPGGKKQSAEVTAVSADGNHVCHSAIAADTEAHISFGTDTTYTTRSCNAILDTRTNELVTPNGIDDYFEVAFGPTGEILLRTWGEDSCGELTLLDSDLNELGFLAEGCGTVADSMLGSYTD